MAEQEPTAEQLAQIAAENEEDEHSVNYKPPAQKSIQEIQELDKDDESLRKYKEALLGRVAVSADPSVPNVVVTRLTLVCSAAPGPLELDLTGGWDLGSCFLGTWRPLVGNTGSAAKWSLKALALRGLGPSGGGGGAVTDGRGLRAGCP